MAKNGPKMAENGQKWPVLGCPNWLNDINNANSKFPDQKW